MAEALTKPIEASESAPAIPAIRTLDLAKRYGSTVALTNLTMTVGKGEAFGFLGPNGAGKTTAVKLLVGLSAPTGGEAWVLDAPVGNLDVRKRIGYLPELFRYQDWLTGREVLELHCRLARLPKGERRDHVDHALELSGLRDRRNDRVGTYSKGMQQRLGLGAALLGHPEVVFLDEPTSALDPVGRHDVREIIRDLKSRGVTVFLNSHLLSEVEQVCDRVAIVNRGKVIAIGTLEELRGATKQVRISAGGLDETALQAVRRFGEFRFDENSLVVSGVEDDDVPDLVARLVACGARIFSVQPAGSLEESFLSLIEEEEHGPAHDSGLDAP
ncbi:MAG TPA: ABC transporter ATP-binding protein [Chloroflexota bacterium]|jgi:ABC-2 type transport system ATP-binding protein|nr:ABC transporter ATP-binding protein [Chloroflexota bacterium]